MKLQKTPLESIRVKWTIYGILFAIATQALCGNCYAAWQVRRFDGHVSHAASVFAVVFAVQGVFMRLPMPRATEPGLKHFFYFSPGLWYAGRQAKKILELNQTCFSSLLLAMKRPNETSQVAF